MVFKSSRTDSCNPTLSLSSTRIDERVHFTASALHGLPLPLECESCFVKLLLFHHHHYYTVFLLLLLLLLHSFSPHSPTPSATPDDVDAVLASAIATQCSVDVPVQVMHGCFGAKSTPPPPPSMLTPHHQPRVSGSYNIPSWVVERQCVA